MGAINSMSIYKNVMQTGFVFLILLENKLHLFGMNWVGTAKNIVIIKNRL